MKKLFIFFTTLVLTLSSVTFAMTPTYTNDAKFNRGVGNCCYYVDGSASGYANQISSAANNWEVTGYGWNPIYMTEVSSNYATHMDFYGRTPYTDSYLTGSIGAYTSYWNSNSTLACNQTAFPTYDYFYTEIILNTNESASYDYRVAKHEMGHAFGLAHYVNSYSIMYPNLSGMFVSTVQQCDHDTINYLYN